MKTHKILSFVLSVLFIVAASFTASPYAKVVPTKITVVKSDIIPEITSTASMDLFSTANDIIIDFNNPDGENLTFVVFSNSGQVLKVLKTSELQGEYILANADLVASGGTGVYHVTMYSGDGKKKVEGGTIVIIRE